MNKRLRPFLSLLVMSLALLVQPTRAASHTWSGAVNGNFSTAGNWSAGGVPTLAETNILVFPVGATRFTVTNDIGALKVSAFSFSGGGYTVRGASTFSVEPNLININCSGGSNTIESIAVGSDDALVLSGALSGAGGLVKNGAGPLYFRGVASNPLSSNLAALRPTTATASASAAPTSWTRRSFTSARATRSRTPSMSPSIPPARCS